MLAEAFPSDFDCPREVSMRSDPKRFLYSFSDIRSAFGPLGLS